MRMYAYIHVSIIITIVVVIIVVVILCPGNDSSGEYLGHKGEQRPLGHHVKTYGISRTSFTFLLFTSKDE